MSIRSLSEAVVSVPINIHLLIAFYFLKKRTGQCGFSIVLHGSLQVTLQCIFHPCLAVLYYLSPGISLCLSCDLHFSVTYAVLL